MVWLNSHGILMDDDILCKCTADFPLQQLQGIAVGGAEYECSWCQLIEDFGRSGVRARGRDDACVVKLYCDPGAVQNWEEFYAHGRARVESAVGNFNLDML